jgi:hypothetical protein
MLDKHFGGQVHHNKVLTDFVVALGNCKTLLSVINNKPMENGNAFDKPDCRQAGQMPTKREIILILLVSLERRRQNCISLWH